MKDAHGDGNPIRGVILGGLLFYGGLGGIYLVYRLGLMLKELAR